MAEGWNVKRVGHIDCPGGGQVWVEGDVLFIGHMRAPGGTSLYDVSAVSYTHLTLPTKRIV